MKLAGSSAGSPNGREAFREKYGREPPEWLIERAERVPWDWEEVTRITEYLGFYRPPAPDPLPRPSIDQHRTEVFANELHEMTPVAAELVTELLDADVYVTEMPYAGNFRTDLAICEVHPEPLRRRLEIMDGSTDSLAEEWKYLKTYRYLRKARPMTYEEFLQEGPYASESTNREVWTWLEDHGLLIRRKGYATVLNLPDHITAHAVELKQRDWETALEQADRASNPGRTTDYWKPNRNPKKYGYADYAWVVLDAGHVTDDVDLERFENSRVGLIALDDGAAVKLVDAAGRSPPKRSMDREHLVEKTIQQIDFDRYEAAEDPESKEQSGLERFAEI